MTAARVLARFSRRPDLDGERLGAVRNRSRSRLLPIVLAALGVLSFLAFTATSASAFLVRSHISQIGGFTNASGVSIDPSNDVWVTDPGNNGLVTEYSPYPANTKIGEQDGGGHFTTAGHFILSAALDGANEHLYAADSGSVVVHVFDAAGAWESTWTGFGEGFDNLAIDNSGTASNGRIYVSQTFPAAVDAVDPTGAAVPFTASAPYIEGSILKGTPTGPGGTTVSFGEPWTMAVAPDGDLYVVDRTGKVVDQFRPSGEFVRQLTASGSGPFGSVSAVAADPTSGNVLVADPTDHVIDEFDSAGHFVGETTDVTSPGALSTSSGLGVDSSGHLYVGNGTTVEVFGAAEPLARESDGGSVSEVSSTAARLSASINPRGLPTAYTFQYGTSSCTLDPSACVTIPSPPASVGSGEGVVKVSQSLAGLQPDTVYSYRLIIENAETGEVFPGPDRSFTTEATTASTLLPDFRQWELVSPPDKQAALLEPINETGVIQASADGRAITYIANAPTEALVDGTSNGTQLLSRRNTSSWASKDISIPNAVATGFAAGGGNEYRFFSEDLSKSIVQPLGGFLPLSPAASEQTPYLRGELAEGGPPCTADCYRPLVTGCPAAALPCAAPIEAAADVPPGTIFANNRNDGPCSQSRGPRRLAAFKCRPIFVGATPDLRHIVVESEIDLSSAESGATARDLYEWSAGNLARVGAIAGAGEEKFLAISNDGSGIVFEGSSEGLDGLLLRDTANRKTVQLDAHEAACGNGCGGGQAAPVFYAATPDLSRVFFTDPEQLTTDAGAEEGAPDLYECRVTLSADLPPACDLTDLTPAGPGEEPAQAQGMLGVSADGSWLYFAAGPTNAPHVYLRHDDTTTLIGVLSVADRHDWEHRLRSHTARVSPNGRWLAFMSQQPLTGYDTRDIATGEPDTEIYLYDGLKNKLTCPSCNPTGARPSGIEYAKISSGSGGLSGGDRLLEFLQQGVAAIVPGGIPITAAQSLYQPRYLSNSGRLFFNSHDALVPQDTNGTMDVYEFEPPNVGSCTEASPTFAPSNGGCVDLISSGTSPLESAFLDASENGDDVFFLTSSRLAPQDTDAERDVYDAHVCTSEVPCLPERPPALPICSGDACQLPATPPVDATPGSLSFSGPGNAVQCRKGQVKQKGKCVKKKTKKQKKKSSGNKARKQKRTSSKHGGHK